MTATEKAMHSLQETIAFYIREVEPFSLGELHKKSSEDVWSIGQMIQHLIQSAQMQLDNIEQCLSEADDSPVHSMGKTDAGIAVFAEGSFPPDPVRVPPSPQYTPAQPHDKMLLIEGLHEMIRQIRDIEPLLKQRPSRRTVAHPRFGGLNAEEWFLLIDMHYRHHLLQLDRLKAFLVM